MACVYNGNNHASIQSCSTITIQANVTEIADSAFQNNLYLTKFIVPNDSSLQIIKKNCFRSCENLESFDFIEGLVSIQGYAFQQTGIKSFNIPSTLTEIGIKCFYNCKQLSEITYSSDPQLTILNSGVFAFTNVTTFNVWTALTDIYGNFFECSSITSFSVNESNPYFKQEDGIIYKNNILIAYPSARSGVLNVPDWVEKIGAYSFANSKIEDVIFSSNSKCTEIQDEALRSTYIHFFESPPLLKYIGARAFYISRLSNFSLHTDYDVYFSNRAFGYCPSLTLYDVEAGNLTTIDGVVYSKSKDEIILFPPAATPTSFTVTKNVKSISHCAFFSSRMSNLIFEEGSMLESIGESSFFSSSITSIHFDKNCPLQNIPYQAFYNSKIVNITLPNACKEIDETALSSTPLMRISIDGEALYFSSIDGVLYNKNQTVLYRFPMGKKDSIVVPASVETIRTYCFEGCKNCSSVSFECESSLSTIEDNAFLDAVITMLAFPDNVETIQFDASTFQKSKIQEIALPGKMKTIDDGAFTKFTTLKKVVIPHEMTCIGNQAFKGCTSLENVEFVECSALTTIGKEAFALCPSLKIIVLPVALETVYSNTFSTQLEDITITGNPSESIINGINWIENLKVVRVNCGVTLNTNSFVAKPAVISSCSTNSQYSKKQPFLDNALLLFLIAY